MMPIILPLSLSRSSASRAISSAFLLSRLEGLSYPEIARQLGVCLSSVEKYMATAIRHCLALRKDLKA
jgi:RNA polymerase sigma-70 factor (ECF subfamily)